MYTLLSRKFKINFYKNKIFTKIFIIFFYIFYLYLGLNIYRDYGIAYDEDIQRLIGLSNFDYITNKLVNASSEIIFPYYGVGYELPLILFEKLFKVNNIEDIFLFRHKIIFLTTIIGNIFYFFLLKKIFKSSYYALLGSLLLIISPRLFAESFYNSKDIIFMHSLIISVFFGLKFLEKMNLKYSFIFGLVVAWSINIRIATLIVPIIFSYFIFIKYLRKEYNRNFYKKIFFNYITIIFFMVLFWPYLWDEPLKNFLNSFLIFKNYNIALSNYYLGNYVFSKSVHWFYLPLWIYITIPVYVLIFFTLGFIRKTLRLSKRLFLIDINKKFNDLWRGKKELIFLIFFSVIFLSIFFSIIFKSTIYNSWRHFYFLYPFILIFALNEIKFLYVAKKKLQLPITLVLTICIVFNIFWLIKSHPYQNIFFNNLAGKHPHEKFEVDYWGLSNKYALEKILKENQLKEKITISNLSDTSLIQNLKYLKILNKDKLIYQDLSKKPDYIIDNNIFFNQNKKTKRQLLTEYEIYDVKYVHNVLLTTIYKKK